MSTDHGITFKEMFKSENAKGSLPGNYEPKFVHRIIYSKLMDADKLYFDESEQG